MKNPADTKPTAGFVAGGVEPIVVNANSYKFALSSQGVQLGWLGQNSSSWAVLVTDPNKALILELYPYNGVNYYRIKGSGSYMSVSASAYIGFYNWLGATGFTMQGTNLVSAYNGQKLSLYSKDDGYLYAWNAYTVLDVKLEPVEKPVIPNQPLTDLIEHVVVLMLENRSFDNMLGGLYPTKTQAEYRGLNGISEQDKSNPLCPPSQERVTVADQATWIMPFPDPGELFEDMNEQIFGTSSPAPGAPPTMQGFACNYSRQPGAPLKTGGPNKMPDAGDIMQYYAQDKIPMFWYLATQFAVCDGWFAAGPVQTLANRIFAHCGTPGRLPGTNDSRINNPDFIKGVTVPFKPPVTDKTIFELLDETYPGEINWKVYYQDAPISALCSYVYDHWNWTTWDSGNVYRWVGGSGVNNFEFDIKNNRLPKYSFLEPCYEDNILSSGPVNNYHPGGAGVDVNDPNGSSLPPPISVLDGERFLKQVYDILAEYPDTFKKTLLIVIFDEHGGVFDHVGPPSAPTPFAPPVQNFPYDRYGVRIPSVLINPCIPPGTIYPPRASPPAGTFDHTSLISTVCAQFGVKGKLTPRSDQAPKLTSLIPEKPQVYTRPEPPVLPPAEPRALAPQPSPSKVDVVAAMAVVKAQKNPHPLAGVLVPLLAVEQQARK